MKKWWFLFILAGVSISLFVFYLKYKKEKPPQKPTSLQNHQTYYYPVPIVKSASGGMPCVMMQVENRNLELGLDLGFQGILAFSKDAMNQIKEKTFIGERTMYGIRGKNYQYLRYQAPTMYIGKLTLSNFVMEEEPDDCLIDSTIGETKVFKIERSGRLGWQLFRSCNLLLDVAVFAFGSLFLIIMIYSISIDDSLVRP